MSSRQTDGFGDTPRAVVVGCDDDANNALIVWLAWTFVNVYVPTVPTDEPSTTTSEIAKQASGVIVKLWSLPALTTTAPRGVMVPPGPADEVIVKVWAPAPVATASKA